MDENSCVLNVPQNVLIGKEINTAPNTISSLVKQQAQLKSNGHFNGIFLTP